MLLGVCLSTAMELFKDYHLAIISACDNEMFSLCMLVYRKQRCPVGDEKKSSWRSRTLNFLCNATTDMILLVSKESFV